METKAVRWHNFRTISHLKMQTDSGKGVKGLGKLVMFPAFLSGGNRALVRSSS